MPDINKTNDRFMEIEGKVKSFNKAFVNDFTVDSGFLRLLALIALISFVSVWTTGYLRTLMTVLMFPSLFVLISGRRLLPFPRLTQFLSLLTLGYILIVYSKFEIPGIVIMLEFTSIIIVLQLQITNNAKTVTGFLVLSLMAILAVAAMNVNFLFPLSLIPYLFCIFIVLHKIVMMRHSCLTRKLKPTDCKTFSPLKLAGLAFLFVLVWGSCFYMIPRTKRYGLASRASKRSLKGFSDALTIGEGGLLEDNPAVVMRIRPSDKASLSLSILRRLKGKLMRGTTFANYSRGRWYRNRYSRYFVNLRENTGQFWLKEDYNTDRTLHQLEINLENTEPPVLFVPDLTVNLDIDSNFIMVESDRSIFFPGRSSARRRYLARVLIDQPPVRDVEMSSLNISGPTRIYLNRNGIDKRIRDLADKLSENATTINQRVKRVMAYLKENCVYSLFESFSAEKDPVVDFLFENRSGACEHFASAMTLLLRSMQVPARPVNGYTMGEWNELGQFFTVRQRHAHSWVEVYFPGSGWIPFDPSPPAAIGEPAQGFSKMLLWLWEVYEGHWFNYVYSFDNKTQSLGFRRIYSFFYLYWKKIRQLIKTKGPYFVGIIALILLLLNLYQRKRKNSGSWLPGWYLTWEKALPETRKSWETPREFHARLVKDGILAKEQEELFNELAGLVDKSASKNADIKHIEGEARKLILRLNGRN
ncbi:MAG: transglutaminaseTgpA domain-containing protein [Candidatus Rifleibacteriota bacterium]